MFVHFNNNIYNTRTIKSVDCTDYVSKGIIRVHFDYRMEIVSGADALGIIQTLCPAVLEGKEAKYVRHAWAVHNLIGHPLMQIFSWLHLTSLGIKIHDATIPDPKEE
jgi:hypothetical protein